MVTAAVASAPGAAGEVRDDARWADVESQIQYGFYSEDLRSLENLAHSLGAAAHEPSAGAAGAGAGAGERAHYFSALAQYRLAELLRDRDRRGAVNAANECAAVLESAPGAADDPESLALAAACLTLARALQSVHLSLFSGDATAALARAVKLAPRNPRVVLIDAVVTYEHHGGRAEQDRAMERFEAAAKLFELERQGLSVVPGWGAAEVYGYLGRLYLDRGNAAAARGALERALLLAPDFAGARRLLTQIVG
jgi:tetratricopeptide (TPR) repeat protein